MYYDKFKGDLKSIEFGNGKISAKLWGYQSKNPKGKKKVKPKSTFNSIYCAKKSRRFFCL